MGLEHIPESIRHKYEVHEWNHACAVLRTDFPSEWNDIITILDNFKLKRSDVLKAGGRKSPIAVEIDSAFYRRDWSEKQFATQVVVDGVIMDSPTHKVDCYKNKVAVEIEWNNKDPFYDRDLNNFRLLHQLRAISVGVIVTRCTALQEEFKRLGKGDAYGNSTTHLGKLLPKIVGGGSAGCPILVFGISMNNYFVNE